MITLSKTLRKSRRLFAAAALIVGSANTAVAGLGNICCNSQRPYCTPACHPTWGYHQTCWRQFPPLEPCVGWGDFCPSCETAGNPQTLPGRPGNVIIQGQNIITLPPGALTPGAMRPGAIPPGAFVIPGQGGPAILAPQLQALPTFPSPATAPVQPIVPAPMNESDLPQPQAPIPDQSGYRGQGRPGAGYAHAPANKQAPARQISQGTIVQRPPVQASNVIEPIRITPAAPTTPSWTDRMRGGFHRLKNSLRRK